jgi:2-amino-4-hydroxy-6-hydroxymethyldihydropteridine diphosphokinase
VPLSDAAGVSTAVFRAAAGCRAAKYRSRLVGLHLPGGGAVESDIFVSGRVAMARCLIGCGSNLGSRRQQLDRAVELLQFMPGVELVAVSRFRETRPIGGPAEQGAFLNGACLIETDLPPADLLGALFAVENTLARRRDERWGPRTIDLDLLLYEDMVVESPDLTLPHPRMATRRFVLEPCAEIAGELPVPLAGCTVRELFDNISVPHPLVAVVGIPGSGAPEVAVAIADATLTRLIRAAAPLPLFANPPSEADASHTAVAAFGGWLDVVKAWQKPLATDGWQEDPTGTICDYWLDAAWAAAAETLSPAAWGGFATACEQLAARAEPPHVAIFLQLSPAELRERIGFRRRAGGHSDVFADLDACGGSEAWSDELIVNRLMAIQDRLERRLRCPTDRCPQAPKAVITITADDLSRATADATAAVEAML